ncbi:hypothetical protein [Hahella ganghwensis]|uniref:hypothetical protein n=1 Tax=Hahella ganghwensis TaxID=286420 RepID=UPI000381E892|nr:hypothetical protein [Hahella ganghwensis]
MRQVGNLWLALMCFVLIGCTPAQVHISPGILEKASYTNGGRRSLDLPLTGSYLAFRFHSSEIIKHVDDDHDNYSFRVIATLFKDGKKIDSSSGIPLTTKDSDTYFDMKGPNYISLNFYDLSLISNDGKEVSLLEIDFDRIDFQFQQPSVPGQSVTSNIVSYSRSDVLEVLTQETNELKDSLRQP